MTATLEYAAAGGNRHSSAADWAPSLLAFGAGKNIALWNPEDEKHRGITSLLAGHTDTVNAIRIQDSDAGRLIISGSADSTIRTWQSTNHTASGFEEKQCLTEHTSSVNALAIAPGSDLFLSGSADASVKVWQFQDTTAKLIQSISLKPRYLPLALAITSLSDGTLIFAVAGTSSIIQLYARSPSSLEFELQASLTGHEGWIRSLDFTKESSEAQSDILLASASQDKYIRVWRLHQGGEVVKSQADIPNGLAIAEKKSLSNKAHQIGSSGLKYSVTFEALLIGHEDWIYTARWQPANKRTATPALMSASADNSLSIWNADPASGLWVCNSRLGEISSQKGSTTATGSAGGFWIGLWQPEGHSVVSLGRTGSWRRWNYDETSDMWLQQLGISGHVQEVQGLAWSSTGDYLLSTSSDQTTRLLAEWHRAEKSSWHEMSRPQIHGYDLNCLDSITENQFISGADEKLLRVFNKPKAVDKLLCTLTGSHASTTDDLPDAANIPVLGLSNKAMEAVADDEPVNGPPNGDPDDRDAIDPASVVHKSTLDLQQPPFEEHLARHTLWPEHEKLYGHGYEISAVAANNSGSVVATACKASSIEHAVIRLYMTNGWLEVNPPLPAHTLTVTSLQFSPDDEFLLSVGRDRQWALFQRWRNDHITYPLHTSNPKGHSRMILDCSWAPVSVGYVFATAGRDKSVKVWKVNESKVELVTTISTGVSATAVAFCRDAQGDKLLLAHGGEDGSITLHWLASDTLEVSTKLEIDGAIRPSSTINTLRWRPRPEDEGKLRGKAGVQLAAASDDCSLRIYNVLS